MFSRVRIGSSLARLLTGRFVWPALVAIMLWSPPSAGAQVPRQATRTPLSLTFAEALERGLKFNIDVIEAGVAGADARAEQLRALSALLPSVSVRGVGVYEDLSLKEIGLAIPGLPPTTGGFGSQDLRVSVTQSIFNRELFDRYRSGQLSERAAALSALDAQDIVVLAVGSAYLQIVATRARLDTANAELQSAQEFDRQAADRVKAEVSPEIDSLRAQVERQTAEQRVVDAANALEKSRLALARLIGMSLDEARTVGVLDADSAPLELTEAAAQARAFTTRADLAAASARIEAADYDIRARRAQNDPTVGVNANYGVGGALPHLNQLYSAAVAVSVPLYTGGLTRAEVLKAQNALLRRRAEYDDLKRRIALDVHSAWLDLTAAESAVAVAQSNQELARRAEAQALNRYANGVTNYLEVVQAREAVVQADETLVASIYAFNVAKLTVARAIGNASVTAKEFFRHDH
jgi:outer membrane protein TolC